MSYVGVRKLYLIAGPPGTGKSHLARLLASGHESTGDNAVHLEADMYFINELGSYEYDPTQIERAHNWCQHMVHKAMTADTPVIIVANTFTRAWERLPYEELAGQWGYELIKVEMNANDHFSPAQLAERNIHGVPVGTIEKMVARRIL